MPPAKAVPQGDGWPATCSGDDGENVCGEVWPSAKVAMDNRGCHVFPRETQLGNLNKQLLGHFREDMSENIFFEKRVCGWLGQQ